MSTTLNLSHAVDARRVLSPVSVSFGPGCHGIIGPNGAGKTTLLRLATGLMELRSGERTAASAAMAHAASDAALVGDTIGDHFSTAAAVFPRFQRECATEVIAPLQLTDRSAIRTLSVGQRQLVAVATAVAAHTEIMALDEPFTGLDVTLRTHLRAVLLSITQQGATVLISSHRAEDLSGLIDDITVVSGRRVRTPLSIDELRAYYPTVEGPADSVTAFIGTATVLSDAHLGGLRRVTLAVDAPLGPPPTGVRVNIADDADAINAAVTHYAAAQKG
ncbi:ATP-binding cassette domain-containing protein [Corynebacterium uberis]|uniref:ATP-binding cassette domain-containing protein n=1 Tax=Corynebacterium TaxID=1716 RepID=UPI001D0A62CF|nr:MULTISPECIES: ATP-binding cassette domain-containing protein [Corynebacterium]MCZ9309278.1 ATP-binding cassette domain-containing protein [Corynebacterium sp. c6VSa_13]UDL72833.1 ATP-binding cassette domain-containing protein [Corynebacterium uberis]UDL76289.1 ATP-binding cassette domain-containing protein [Corynebacterium uberis]UDL78502.1 ATP-binding cassette domain-containing protein [Corynebacterium uberis]UDL80783.1 ATP-binding cassette domain-containing protein [Corynebacterium uberis